MDFNGFEYVHRSIYFPLFTACRKYVVIYNIISYNILDLLMCFITCLLITLGTTLSMPIPGSSLGLKVTGTKGGRWTLRDWLEQLSIPTSHIQLITYTYHHMISSQRPGMLQELWEIMSLHNLFWHGVVHSRCGDKEH